MPGLRHPSSWSACHHRAEAAEAVLQQRLEAAAVPVDDPCPWAAAGANPGRERHPVRPARERSVVACPQSGAMPSAERVLQLRKAVVVVHPHQAAEVAAHPCPSQVAGAEVHPCEAAEAAGHRRHPTSLGAECTHRAAVEVLHRTAAVPADHLRPWEAAEAEHPAYPCHPSSEVRAAHPEHPSSEAEHPEHPSWVEAHLGHPWEAVEAEHPAYPCRPSSEAAEAEHLASPCHPSSAEVQAEHPACPCCPSWAEELREHRRHKPGALESHLEPADNPAAVTVAQREFPPSMAASAAQIPAPLPRCVEHPGTACAGCSCAAEHTASSTR